MKYDNTQFKTLDDKDVASYLKLDKINLRFDIRLQGKKEGDFIEGYADLTPAEYEVIENVLNRMIKNKVVN